MAPQGQNEMRTEGDMPLRVRLSDRLGRTDHLDNSRHRNNIAALLDSPLASSREQLLEPSTTATYSHPSAVQM